MRYFASNNTVTTEDKSKASGWLEISEQQYNDGVEALMSGREIIIEGGFLIRDQAPSPEHVWQNGQWVLPPTPEPEPPTPEEIRAAMPPLTARQLRLGLIGGGFSLSDVDATIDAIPDAQQKAVAQIEWQYAVQFERMHPLIEQVGASLGLTPEQIDTMWQAALEL